MVPDTITRAGRYWREIRAGLILLVILVGLLDGLPIPAPHERPAMKKRLSPGMVEAVETLDRTRNKLLKPFRPIGELAGLRQRWKLFSGASRNRFRMWIEARRDLGRDEWEILYRPLDDEHMFLHDQLEYRRVRGAWNPSTSYGPRSGYHSFCTWVANRVFDADPAYQEVRVRMEKARIGPHGGITFTGELVHPQWRRRPRGR
jgi:hypothetical protein